MRFLVAALVCGSVYAFAQAPSPYNRGVQAFADGDFVAAARLFEEAYKANNNPAILFDLAQSHRRLFEREGEAQRARDAIDCYQRYLASGKGDDSSRATATSEMERLQKRLKAMEAPPKQQVRNPLLRPLGASALVVGTAGLALTVGGAAVYGIVDSEYQSLDAACRKAPCDPSDFASTRDRVTAGNALIGVGAALLVVDAVLIGFYAKERRRPLVDALRGRVRF